MSIQLENAAYEAKQGANISKIDSKTTEETTEFFETYFKPYPTAPEKELKYMEK